MQIKDGVILAGLKIEMRPVLILAEKIWEKYGQPLTVTCGLDGEHSAGSLHYYGFAVDLRIRDFSEGQRQSAWANLKSKLGIAYDVVLHKTHIHVEFDLGKS
jgi:hypothetical protein